MNNQEFKLNLVKSLSRIESKQEDHTNKLSELFKLHNDKIAPAVVKIDEHIKHHPSFQKTVITISATVTVVVGILKLLEYIGGNKW